MDESPFSDQKVEFPITWPFKIICIDTDSAEQEVNKVLEGLGLKERVQRGRSSKNGKYVTYTVDIEFFSKERLDFVSEALRNCPAVHYLI